MARTHEKVFQEVCQTQEFQRLYNIQQLGLSSKVFPSLDHSRGVHSLGVYEKAEWFLDVLEKNSEIKIDPFHKLCVKMAGLLHDIGHGPFSHFWEKVINQFTNEEEFKHEKIGALIVEKVFMKVKLSEDEKEHHYGVDLVKRLIVGNKKGFEWKDGTQDEFIFDIINNQTCAIDVDRLDYLHRDWENCQGQISIPHMNVEKHLRNVDMLFEGARVSPSKKFIQFNEEHTPYINSMFKLREAFTKFIYQCPKVSILEDILLDLIQRISSEDNNRPRFLTLESEQQYVDEIMCHDVDEIMCLNDKYVEDWLHGISNSELKSKLRALNDFDGTVLTSSEDVPGYIKVTIRYKYSLKPAIEGCLYGNRRRDDLIMNYSFEEDVFYKFQGE